MLGIRTDRTYGNKLLDIETTGREAGETVSFDRVLMYVGDDNTLVGLECLPE